MSIDISTNPMATEKTLPEGEKTNPVTRTVAGSDGQSIGERVGRLSDGNKQNNPHAFVVMPFGIKPGPDGRLIDFNAIYTRLIKPALLEAEFKPFRADEETVSGDILTDMFQELLLADLVVVDMSIDNANVFYELGVRHALRKRGVVHIQSGRAYMPFDVFSVRTLTYHIDEKGVPDKDQIERDKKSLIRITRDTWASDSEAVHSPVFGLLTGLKEPDTRSLRTPLATGFWREFNEWEERVAVARQQQRVGDILLLTREINNPLCKEEAVKLAGLALRELGRNELALQEYRNGLSINPRNLFFRREEARLLNRMGRVDAAIIKLENLLEDAPYDTRATSHLGRIYTNIWHDCWTRETDIQARQRAAFDSCQWAIKSIDTYLRGFNLDRNKLEPGMKALTLVSLLVPLAEQFDVADNPDVDLQRVRELFPLLQDSLLFALRADSDSHLIDFWTWASLGNWHLVNEESDNLIVGRMYRKALSYARKNVSQLRSSRWQLQLYLSLGIHGDKAKSAADVLEGEISRIEVGEKKTDVESDAPPDTDVLAFLFSGHMLDQENMKPTRFPPLLEDEVRRQVDMSLARGEADANDHGYTSGAACGGDIIFIEACLKLGMQVHVHMPCAEDLYLSTFISFAGQSWIARYYELRNNPRVNLYYQEERVGKAPEGVDMYERNAKWTLYSSLKHGVDKLRLIALWDRKAQQSSDKEAKRVSLMFAMTKAEGGIVDHIDINTLNLFQDGSSNFETASVVEIPMEARIGLLQKVALFSSLRPVDLTQIARHAIERRYAAGSLLATQGESGDELFIIAAGSVSVRSNAGPEKEREVARRKVGDYVGELSLLQNESRMASLVAIEDVLALTIDQVTFHRILRVRPETSLAITRTLVERLTEATSQPADRFLTETGDLQST